MRGHLGSDKRSLASLMLKPSDRFLICLADGIRLDDMFRRHFYSTEHGCERMQPLHRIPGRAQLVELCALQETKLMWAVKVRAKAAGVGCNGLRQPLLALAQHKLRSQSAEAELACRCWRR